MEGSVDEGHRKREDAQLQMIEMLFCLRGEPNQANRMMAGWGLRRNSGQSRLSESDLQAGS